MSELEARSVKDEATVSGRTVIRFTPAEWAMVEEVAAYEGVTWREWVGRTMLQYRGDEIGKTRAAFIRQQAEDAYRTLLGRQTRQAINIEYMEGQETAAHPMLKGFYVLDDETFMNEMNAARAVFSIDGGGYVFHAGYRAKEFGGAPALFIEDKHRNGAHIILTEGDEQ